MAETVAIIDYGSGNLRSAAKAFERAAREAELDTAILVTADPEALARADRIVLPGVGAFADCKAGLTKIPGMLEVLTRRVVAGARPFLGICVGMQLMASRGLEHGTHEGFGWIPGVVRKLAPSDPSLKVPHMGWNELTIRADHPAFASLPANVRHAYFVHSFHLVADDPAHVLADVDYGGPTTAIVGTGTMIGTQFHPEKSQALGLALIAGFLRWRP